MPFGARWDWVPRNRPSQQSYNPLVRALVIDPNETSRDSLRRVLAERGAQVRSVESLADGRRLAAEFTPDAVVVALDAPDGDALGFVESLLASSGGRGPEVFALVEQGALDSAVRAMEAGASDFLWRPVTDGRVALLLARLAARRQRAETAEDFTRHLRAAMAEPGPCLIEAVL